MPARAPHLSPRPLAVVLLGGFCGTALRYAAESAWPSPATGWPWATFGVNLLGAFGLGALLEGLARRGPDEGRRRLLRLGLGTGLLGSFTTYSSLAGEADLLVRGGALATGAAYAVLSVALGLLAALLGVLAAARHHRWRTARRPAVSTTVDPDADPDAPR
ncbi:FluC/FEX family fluoride channel [Kineococcus sp. SYSU DK004]|uniref:FluC/FEX family fluoride channel n=1 Tax=Kineococcus sp. SYSU DK004 TaxID=3383125 RepID=UPI003D7EF811